MLINITEKEFYAIIEILDQVMTDYEAASDTDYLKKTEEAMKLIDNIIRKYKSARQKNEEFKQIRSYVAARNRGLRSRDVDKLTRILIKKIREGGEDGSVL